MRALAPSRLGVKVWQLFTLALVATLGGELAPAPVQASQVDGDARSASGEFVPGEVIVRYKRGLVMRTRTDMNALYSATGVRKVERLGESSLRAGLELLKLNSNVKLQDALAELNRNPLVEYAQPNYLLRILPIDSAQLGIEPDACVEQFELALFPGSADRSAFPPGCERSRKQAPPPEVGGSDGFVLRGGSDCLFTGCTGGRGANARKPAVQPAPVEPIAADDPKLGELYGLAKTETTEAWQRFRGDKRMVVGVVDTGVDYNHSDLAFNMWRNPSPTVGDTVGYNFVHDDGLPFDDQGHGSHTSGTVGAVGRNGIGISGVNQRVSIMALKFLGANGSGSTAGAIKAIDYGVANGARILSNSWGSSGPMPGNDALKDSIDRARAKGVLFVAAAGNSSINNDTSPSRAYPASFELDNIISVAATDSNDRLASFSNYGARTTHLAAPGVDVLSTVPNASYRRASGTSMACPHVAGAAALVWAANPSLNYSQVRAILLKSVDPVASLNGKVVTGGRLNVARALSQAGVSEGGWGGFGRQGDLWDRPSPSSPSAGDGWPFPTR